MSDVQKQGAAIVGIACRFPGSANGPQAFWDLLCEGRDAITDMPNDRFDVAEVFDADPQVPGRMYSRWGGFIDRIDAFDPAFFGISPREALRMDVQQRLLLESVWEALEDAGIPADQLAGSRTGVYVGISTHDYGDIEMFPDNRVQLDAHSNTGTATSIAANRISYLYDFRGPSFTVDTACSSALTAAHLACRALRDGEIDMAIVAGVQALVRPELTMGFCKASMLSVDGRCKAFDHRANGYVRAEGVGVVVLKSVSPAVADNDTIYAVIRGTAINQDGRTNGLTVPNPDAQEALIRSALVDAGLSATDVGYVEAHGPGTPVGDPLEADALGRVLGVGRDAPCLIGSVKTNIGHLEAASGIAGLIKAALCVRHRKLPASLHFEKPNPDIDFDTLGLEVVTELRDWPAGRAVAGVNSFGFGGANAHVLLEAAPDRAALPSEELDEAGPQLFVLTARSEAALQRLASLHLRRLRAPNPSDLHDLCTNVAQRRSHNPHRLAIVATDLEALDEGLDAWLAGERRATVVQERVPREPGKLAFVFSGMGPQRWDMGRQLMASQPVFRATLEKCDALLRPMAPWGLLEELGRDEASSRVGDADLAQVTSFAMQAGLVDLFRSWGIEPDAVLGHSAGEMAASYASGALGLRDCLELAWHRSRLQATASGMGGMLAVAIDEDEARRHMAPFGDAVTIAAINAPTSLTLSGDVDALDAIRQTLEAAGAFARNVPVKVPYHSVRMDPIREELIEHLAFLRPEQSQVPMVSEVTGDWIDGPALDAEYWWRNVRDPVQFAKGVQTLMDAGCTRFVDVGAWPVLTNAIAECLKYGEVEGRTFGALLRREPEPVGVMHALARLYTSGHPLDFATIQGPPKRHLALPTYPFEQERYWFENASSGGERPRAARSDEHPLLGRSLPTATPTREVLLESSSVAFLDDHLVQGALVYPGAAYTEMALSMSAEGGANNPAVRRIVFHRALFMPTRQETVLQLVVNPETNHFEVHGAGIGREVFNRHASGTLSECGERPEIDLEALKARCPREIGHDEYYGILEGRGLHLGGAFRGIRTFKVGEGEAFARVEHPDLDTGPYRFHPALLDAAFQPLIGAALPDANAVSGLFLPVGIRSIELFGSPGTAFWSYARVVSQTETEVEGDVFVVDDAGQVVCAIRGLACKVLEAPVAAREGDVSSWLYEYVWEPLELPAAASLEGTVLNPGAPERVSILADRADTLSAESGWRDYYGAVESSLNTLAVAYIHRALRTLGWEPSGELPATEALAEQLGVVPRSRRLFSRLVDILAAEDALGDNPSGGNDSAELSEGLHREHGDYDVDIRMLDRCGAHLAGVLDGSTDAREVLFSAEAFPLLSELYRDSPPSRFYNMLAAESLVALLPKAPADRPLRVLELGAGTGGTTSYLLPKLAGLDFGYVFTDISAYFTDTARLAFQNEPSLTTATLDIETDPLAQGFSPGSFDIIIAANVLHATARVEHSLAHVRELLAPGGALVLQEITHQPLWLDIVFGLTDGWWRFEDTDLRPDHPILKKTAWCSLLERCGFDSPTGVSDTSPGGTSAQTVLVGWKSTLGDAPMPRVHRRWLVLADEGGLAIQLADNLPGEVLLRTRADLAPGRAGLSEALREAGPVDAVIHVWSADAPENDALDGEGLMAAQELAVHSVLDVVHALDAADRPGVPLWLITQATQAAGGVVPRVAASTLMGLARVIIKEQTGLPCHVVDLGPAPDPSELRALAREIRTRPGEEEVALRAGERWVRRLRRAPEPDAGQRVERPSREGEAFLAHPAIPGNLDSVGYQPRHLGMPEPNEVLVRIEAAALNFRDVMLAMGLLHPDAIAGTIGDGLLGLDAAGVVEALGSDVDDLEIGQRVVAAGPGTLGSKVMAPRALVAPLPEGMSFTDGAHILIAFITALYALRDLARLGPGERVLIHSASGGVGLAAIQVAREAGAVIYATAGTEEKREHLVSMGIELVMDSRSLDFADQVRAATHGKGVDVVLNSLSGDGLIESLRLLAPYGRFVELGKRDIYEDSALGMKLLMGNASLFTVDIDRMGIQRPDAVGALVDEIAEGFGSGRFEPLPYDTFPASQLPWALREMARAQHIGKIVLDLNDEALVVRADPYEDLLSEPCTVLISGGLGGFGLAVARRLAEGGCDTVVLMGRSAPWVEAIEAIAAIEALGTKVDVQQGDVTSTEDLDRILLHVRQVHPPLGGVIHAAMVLDDAPLDQQDRARVNRVMGPKALGAWNLHKATLDDDLRFFVSFSSIAALLGNPLQANYAAANAFFDGLAHYRRSLGLPALDIAWGVLRDIGYLGNRADLADYLARQGYLSFSEDQALTALQTLLPSAHTQRMVARIDWPIWKVASPTAAASARFGHLVPTGSESAGSERAGLAGMAGLTAEEQAAAIEQALLVHAAATLGTSPTAIDAATPLTEVGLDSLMAVEFMTSLKTDFGVELPVVRLLQGMSVRDLVPLAAERIDTSAPSAPRAPPTHVPVETTSPATKGVSEALEAEASEGEASEREAPEGEAPDTEVVPWSDRGGPPAEVGAVDYRKLDYGRWNTRQRVVRGFLNLAYRSVAAIDAQGLERLPASEPYILAINHLSMNDAPLMLTLAERPVITLAADYLREKPIIHWFLSDLGHAIYVKRGEGDRSALERGLQVLEAGGVLGLSPEGTRGAGLSEGQIGAAWLALKAGVPVVPMVAWGQEHIRWSPLGRASVQVRVGEPIRFEAAAPSARLLRDHTDRIMCAMASMMPEAYRGAYADRLEAET